MTIEALGQDYLEGARGITDTTAKCVWFGPDGNVHRAEFRKDALEVAEREFA